MLQIKAGQQEELSSCVNVLVFIWRYQSFLGNARLKWFECEKRYLVIIQTVASHYLNCSFSGDAMNAEILAISFPNTLEWTKFWTKYCCEQIGDPDKRN